MYPMLWKYRDLTTGPPEKFQKICFLKNRIELILGTPWWSSDWDSALSKLGPGEIPGKAN